MWRVRGLVKEITKRSFEVHLLQLQVFSGDQRASQNTQENKRLESLESRATWGESCLQYTVYRRER